MPKSERPIRPTFSRKSAPTSVCSIGGAAPTSPWLGLSCYLPSRILIHVAEWRWHTEPLDAIQDRCKQLSWNRHLSHLECFCLEWGTTFVQILISFSRSVVHDQCFTDLGSANRRRKFPRLYANSG